MRPGPKPTCDCGGCRYCKQRLYIRAHYLRHSEAIKRKSREYYAEHKKKYNSAVLDELDLKCLNCLKQEGFR